MSKYRGQKAKYLWYEFQLLMFRSKKLDANILNKKQQLQRVVEDLI